MSKIKNIFDNQKSNFIKNHKAQPITYRVKQLKSIRNWIKTNESRIENALFLDIGKHPVEVGFGEIKIVLSEIDEAINNLNYWTYPKRVPTPLYLFGSKSEIRLEPKGVCLIISPWNFPFNLTLAPLVSALAAGNCCILKPSEMTTNTSELLQEMIDETFPPNEVALVQGSVDVSTELLELPFDHIFFTGSPSVGKIVMKKAAENLTSVTLELGGENPIVVDETADITSSAKKIAWNIGFNAGQSCVSGNYVFAHKSIAQSLLEQIKTEIKKLYPTNIQPISENKDYPKLINAKHFEFVNGLINDAKNRGAIVWSAEEPNAEKRFVAPTLLHNLDRNSKILNIECFGPVAPILEYENIQDVYDFILSKPKPLASYLFSNSRKNKESFIANISSGLTVINDTSISFINTNLPFGGVNHSGIGKSHGLYGFKSFSNEKAISYQSVKFTIPMLIYPPYSQLKKSLVQIVKWWL